MNDPTRPPLTGTDINALARMGLPRTSLDLPKENTTMTTDKTPERGENTTRDGIVVRPGQVWEDCDKRMNGRRVIVRFVEGGKAVVEPVSGGRRSVLSVARMHPTSTGFKLVQEATR